MFYKITNSQMSQPPKLSYPRLEGISKRIIAAAVKWRWSLKSKLIKNEGRRPSQSANQRNEPFSVSRLRWVGLGFPGAGQTRMVTEQMTTDHHTTMMQQTRAPGVLQ